MARVINTPFDGTIDEDVQLEQVQGSAINPEQILGNAENVYKSFLYLRDMYSMYPQKKQTIGALTDSVSDYTTLNIPTNVNRLIVKNYKTDANLYLKFNGDGEYIIFPSQTEEISIIATTDSTTGTKVEYKGNISVRFVIEQEF